MIVITLLEMMPTWLWFFVLLAAGFVLVKWLYKSRLLPPFVTQYIDRLANKFRPNFSTTQNSQKTQTQTNSSANTNISSPNEASHKYRLDTSNVIFQMKEKIFGHDYVVDDIVNHLDARLAAESRHEPLGVFCFAGPENTGKSFFAETLAETISSAKEFLHFNMTFFDDNSGYRQLSEKLDNNTFLVIYMENFSQTSSQIQQNFLTSWNKGYLPISDDKSFGIPTTNTVFILSAEIEDNKIQPAKNNPAFTPKKLHKNVEKILKNGMVLPNKVINRFDRIFAFPTVDMEAKAKVYDARLHKLAEQYAVTIKNVSDEIFREIIASDGALQDNELPRILEVEILKELARCQRSGITNISLEYQADHVIAKQLN